MFSQTAQLLSFLHILISIDRLDIAKLEHEKASRTTPITELASQRGDNTHRNGPESFVLLDGE